MSIDNFETRGAPLSRRRFLALTGGVAGALAIPRPVRAFAQSPLAVPGRLGAQTTPNAFQLTAGPATIDLGEKRSRPGRTTKPFPDRSCG